MGRGSIRRRGKRSWQIRFDDGVDGAGRRRARWATVKGTRQDAQRELTRLLAAVDAGTLPEPSTTTVAEYLRQWIKGDPDLSPKTSERYLELAELQIIPHLGATVLQRLRPKQVKDWHGVLLKSGAKNGRPLTARTVGHAHRVLHRALQMAVETEVLARNVASAISPPSVKEQEIEILDEDQMNLVTNKLADADHHLHAIVVVDLATGLRRGEMLALRLSDVDLEAATVRVERSLEETKNGLRFKPPKTERGKRTIGIPPNTVTVLRDHRRKLLESRMALGLGKPDGDTLLFAEPDGSPTPPNRLTRRWQDACVSLRLPRVSFHALRHTHASALIASGLDVVLISRRLGHANPTVTLNTYGHLFKRDDSAAADAMEKAMTKTRGEPGTP